MIKTTPGTIFLVVCKDCRTYFYAICGKHNITYCPKGCGNAVDISPHYQKIIGNCQIIKDIGKEVI